MDVEITGFISGVVSIVDVDVVVAFDGEVGESVAVMEIGVGLAVEVLEFEVIVDLLGEIVVEEVLEGVVVWVVKVSLVVEMLVVEKEEEIVVELDALLIAVGVEGLSSVRVTETIHLKQCI